MCINKFRENKVYMYRYVMTGSLNSSFAKHNNFLKKFLENLDRQKVHVHVHVILPVISYKLTNL